MFHELIATLFSNDQDVDHLKPHIVRALANAELYCMALSHLYQDPNYHNLNHWGIIQALARKGVSVAEPSDCALTESMLIQVAPLKMVSYQFRLCINYIFEIINYNLKAVVLLSIDIVLVSLIL